MRWLILRTEPAKEQAAARAIAIYGFKTYLPLEIRSHRPSRHTKRRVITETPLIPRILFAVFPLELLDKITQQRYIQGIIRGRDEQARPWTISDEQMTRFQEAHQAWLETATKLHRAGQPGKARKAKWRPIEALREFFTESDTA